MIMEHQQNYTDREKRSIQTKLQAYPISTFPTTNPTQTGLESNSGLKIRGSLVLTPKSGLLHPFYAIFLQLPTSVWRCQKCSTALCHQRHHCSVKHFASDISLLRLPQKPRGTKTRVRNVAPLICLEVHLLLTQIFRHFCYMFRLQNAATLRELRYLTTYTVCYATCESQMVNHTCNAIPQSGNNTQYYQN